ncbi:hypothetical protein RhiJN_20664 [Ceratobasidium sp. AG-Ba]|nr:hypothetical protein RhiJN_20664 [Ceratobasidium sp. AG-Ba]
MPRYKTEPYPNASLNQSNICVSIATADEGEFLNAYTVQDDKPLKKEPLTQICWMCVKLGLKIHIHVGYDGINPPYPGVGGLAIAVFFDGRRASDMFIVPESIADRVKQKLAKRAEATKGRRGKRLSQAKLNELEATVVVEGESYPGATEIVGCPCEKGKIRPFYFASRRFVATDQNCGSIGDFGKIEVQVRWAEVSTGQSGSLERLYDDIYDSFDVVPKVLASKYRLVAAVENIPSVNEEVNAEREAEGGYRFTYTSLDEKVYKFVFHYATEDVLKDEGFLVPDRTAGPIRETVKVARTAKRAKKANGAKAGKTRKTRN